MCLLSVTPCGCGKALPIILSQSSADGFLPVGFGSEGGVTLCYTLCHAHCIPWLPDPAEAFDYMNSLSWIGWQRRPPKGTTSLLCGEVKNAVLLLWKPPLSLPMTLAHDWSLVFILWLCWEYQCEADQTWREASTLLVSWWNKQNVDEVTLTSASWLLVQFKAIYFS